MQVKPATPSTVTLYRYHQLVRKNMQFRAFEHGGLDVAARAIQSAAAVMDNPPELINVGIEQLVKDRLELRAFSTLDCLGRRIRALVNGRFFAEMERRLTTEEKERLDALVQSKGSAAKSPLHDVKRLPKRFSLKHFQELLDHMAKLEELVATEQPLAGIPELKRKHFAAEAWILDAAELKGFQPAKRRALLLCLIHRARVQVRDDLADMFIKRIGKIHNHGKEELERLRIHYPEKAETLVATLRMVQLLDMKSTTEDQSLIDVMQLILAQERSRSESLDEPVDLSFTTHLWRTTLAHQMESGEERIHRRHLKVCVSRHCPMS